MDPATDWVVGEKGYALDFDNSDDYVDTNTQIQALTTNRGSVVWTVQPNAAFNSGTVEVFWSQLTGTGNPEFSAQHFSDNNMYIGFSSGGGDSRVVVAASPSNWILNGVNCYILTWEASGLSILYHNGKRIGDNGGGTTIQTPSNNLLIGRMDLGPPRFWDGQVSQFSVYNRILFLSEAQQLFVDQFAVEREKAQIIPFAPAVAAGYVGPLVNGPIIKTNVGGGLVAA